MRTGTQCTPPSTHQGRGGTAARHHMHGRRESEVPNFQLLLACGPVTVAVLIIGSQHGRAGHRSRPVRGQSDDGGLARAAVGSEQIANLNTPPIVLLGTEMDGWKDAWMDRWCAGVGGVSRNLGRNQEIRGRTCVLCLGTSDAEGQAGGERGLLYLDSGMASRAVERWGAVQIGMYEPQYRVGYMRTRCHRSALGKWETRQSV